MRRTRLPVALVFLSGLLAAETPDGYALYKTNCASCHDAGFPRVPTRDGLKLLTPEAVHRSLVSGAMRFQGTYLSMAERRAVAEFVTGKEFEKSNGPMGMCAGKSASKPVTGDWNGWGLDPENSRFQSGSSAGLAADAVPKLKLRWAFGFPGDFVAFSQPAVSRGRLYVGSASGNVYALDAATGCTHWVFEAGAGVRTGITLGPGPAIYFGDLQANVYALNDSGKQLWKAHLDDHPVARITGAPKLHDGKLYVPVSSHEEWASADPSYECCKFRGSVVALDAKTGKQIWKTYTIAEAPRQLDKKNKVGKPFWGPSGAGIWSSPTVDVRKNLLYVGTGDSYSEPTVRTSDAILAMDLGSGKIVWSRQLTEKDAFNTTCIIPPGINCPDAPGPDFDFGASPILRSLPGGKRALIAAQKSGVVHALDPDQQGEILWQTRIGKGGVLGGIQWGPAADRDTVYVALSDFGLKVTDFTKLQANEGFGPDPNAGGGLFALKVATGEKLWDTPSPGKGCTTKGCSPAQSAAVTAIPGVVFSGALDGHLRAYAMTDGQILWDVDTVREYETVNSVKAKGGSIDGPGPVVVGGMVFVNSGYGYFNAIPGNVLLAFSVDGK